MTVSWTPSTFTVTFTFSLPEDLEEMTVWLSRTDLVLEGKYQELFERCKANQEPGNAAALLARRNNKK